MYAEIYVVDCKDRLSVLGDLGKSTSGNDWQTLLEGYIKKRRKKKTDVFTVEENNLRNQTWQIVIS